MPDQTTPHSSTPDSPTPGTTAPVPAPPPGPRSLPGDAGMATAEYAIATLAACGFAGLLVAVLSSGQVRGMLMAVVERALTLA